jgi:hypothetical protein
LNWTGTATPISYQLRDVFGQKVESTYTPTIEPETVASGIAKFVKLIQLPRTGGDLLYGTLQVMVFLVTVGVGLKMSARHRRRPEAS